METEFRVEEIDATRRRLAIEVPSDAVRSEMDRAFGRVQQQATIKGFRPGRVPRTVLEKYFGDQVRADVLSHLIEHSYAEAVAKAGLRPAGPPEIVPERMETGHPLRYTATLDVLPVIEITADESLPAKRPRKEVTEADVDAALEHLRESLAQLRLVEDRTEARQGDFVSIDWEATIAGQPAPNGSRQNRLVEIGRGSVPPEIDAALEGAKANEPVDVAVSFPAEYPDAAVAGKTVDFRVTVKAIREKVVPPADDELAKEHGETSTLAELREMLRRRLAESWRAEAEDQVRSQVLEALVERNPFDVPSSLVDRQIDAMVEDLVSRAGGERAALEKDAERLEKLRTEIRPRAERQVRAVLALDAYAQKHGLAVSDDELESRIGEMAGRAGERAQKLLEYYRDERAREDLRGRMVRERAVDAIVAKAAIEEVDVPADVIAPVE